MMMRRALRTGSLAVSRQLKGGSNEAAGFPEPAWYDGRLAVGSVRILVGGRSSKYGMGAKYDYRRVPTRGYERQKIGTA